MSLLDTAISAGEASKLSLTHAWQRFQGNNRVRLAAERGQKHVSFHMEMLDDQLCNFVEAAKELGYKVRIYERNDNSKTVTLRWK